MDHCDGEALLFYTKRDDEQKPLNFFFSRGYIRLSNVKKSIDINNNHKLSEKIYIYFDKAVLCFIFFLPFFLLFFPRF